MFVKLKNQLVYFLGNDRPKIKFKILRILSF